MTQRDERVRPAQRPDASMSLLNDLFVRPLDEGYAESAARRAAGGGTERTRPPRRARIPWGLLIGALAVALILTTAALQTRRTAGVASAERESLVSRIEQRDSYTEQLERQVDALQQDVVGLESARLASSAEGEELREGVLALQAATGTNPAVGPGILLTVDDAPPDASGAGDGGEAVDFGRVLDVDLQRVLNGLWAAGAEAVSINGQRVTALTAIRSANDVILVNYRPLRPPYEIRAIGDPRTLPSRFAEGTGGAWLRAVAGAHGITFDIRSEEELTLPGSGGAVLRYATTGDGG